MTDKMDTSSPESSGEKIATPKEQIIATSALSPPDSQQRNMPTSASGSSLANSNGKRPINTISNGNDDIEEIASMGNGGVSVGGGKPFSAGSSTKTHRSGYTWSSEIDEPGYSWTCKRAQDELKRATDQMVHKDSMVRATYGDVFEVVENEKAVLASIKQR